MRVLILLYAFASADAYFTVREANQGLDPVGGSNPRVAAILNLLTNGFGYFYVGERKKGLALFFGLWLANGVARTAPTVVSVPVGVVLELLAWAIAADAYRIGAAMLADDVARRAVPETPPATLPAWLPLGCSGVVLLVWVGLVFFGVIALLFGFVRLK